jgi:hypothetical protein
MLVIWRVIAKKDKTEEEESQAKKERLAKKRADKGLPPRDASKSKSTSGGNGNGKAARKVEFEWEQDWGETLTGVCSPRIYALFITDKSIR